MKINVGGFLANAKEIYSVANPAIGKKSELPPLRPLPKMWCLPGPKFQTINESPSSLSCKHIYFINMGNSLFRLLILIDGFNELQLIDKISKFGAALP